MSKIEVNAVEPQCGTTLTLGASGDTVTIPSGATISNLGTAAGFGSTGEVSWDTTKKTTGFTATSGVGYFCDTTSAAFTVTLPATPSAGNVVAVSDYAGTFGTNELTVDRNSSNINGSAANFNIGKNNVTAQFIYVDATQGWRVVFTGSQTGEGLQQGYICATGGTITTCGNYKIHTFTGPGTFTVSSLACSPANDVVDYLVIAGGASGGGGSGGGGGGAGGYRESSGAASGCYTRSPLGACVSALPVSAQGYPITVGGGGTSQTSSCKGNDGSNSIFSTITSAGGGAGGGENTPQKPGNNGGSGGGAQGNPGTPGGTGNTPPVSPPQGNNGGNGVANYAGGGGGGATGTGGTGPNPAGAGGAGATSCITASPVARAGGGGGGNQPPAGCGPGPASAGGGDGGVYNTQTAQNATANTGGGGGGGAFVGGSTQSGAGGSGIVIIRYKYQ